MIQGKGKNLSFEIKTKAAVTGVTPATQLHEVKREHQDTKGCSVVLVWALIPSQGGKDPKFPSIPAQRLLHPLGLGSWRGTTPRAPKAQALPCPCCQQPLTATPGTFPEAFPSWFQGSCSGSHNSGSAAALGVGSVLHPSFLGRFPWCSCSQG